MEEKDVVEGLGGIWKIDGFIGDRVRWGRNGLGGMGKASKITKPFIVESFSAFNKK